MGQIGNRNRGEQGTRARKRQDVGWGIGMRTEGDSWGKDEDRQGNGGGDEDKAGGQMCERDGAAKGRDKVREAERGERQAWDPHKDGQGPE